MRTAVTGRSGRAGLVDRGAVPAAEDCTLDAVYQPAPVSEGDLAVMRRLDELYLATPSYRTRRMVAVLRREGWSWQHGWPPSIPDLLPFAQQARPCWPKSWRPRAREITLQAMDTMTAETGHAGVDAVYFTSFVIQ